MTRKLIMLAPQAHSQCSFAVRISLYASWGACQQKKRVGKKTRPTALLQVRMQSCQPKPVFFPPHITCLSCSPRSGWTPAGWAVMSSHPGSPQLSLLSTLSSQNPFVAWGCLQHCQDLLSHSQKSHQLFSMACDKKGLTRVSATELIPTSDISPSEFRRNRKSKDVSTVFLHV